MPPGGTCQSRWPHEGAESWLRLGNGGRDRRRARFDASAKQVKDLKTFVLKVGDHLSHPHDSSVIVRQGGSFTERLKLSMKY